MPREPARPWRVDGDHLLLAVRATPRAGRDAIDRIEQRDDGSALLRVKLKAAPVDGAANEALRRFLAKACGVKPGAVAIESGETSRVKILRLPLSAAPALARLSDSRQDRDA